MAFSGSYDSADFTNPSSDLTDYVALVDLSQMSASWWADVDTSDPTKGRASKDDGTTELAVDWVEFDDVAETGFAWVRWSGTLSSTGTNTVRIYPPKSGNSSYASTATFGSEAVWADLDAGWHLNEDPSGTAPQFADITGNGFDGTANGTMTSGDSVAGKIGNAVDFDGSDDFIGVGSPETLANSDFTWLAWVKLPSDSSDRALYERGGAGSGYAVYKESDDNLHAYYRSDALYEVVGGTIGDNTFHQVGFRLSGTTLEIILDGAVGTAVGASGEVTSVSQMTSNPGDNAEIGVQDGGDVVGDLTPANVLGLMDEVFILNGALSDDYIDLFYSNQNDPATFWGTWTYTAGGGGNTELTPNGLSHNHTLAQSDIQIQLTPDGLSHGHVLDQSNIQIQLSPNDLSHPHALDQSNIQILLSPNALSHSHGLDQLTVSPSGQVELVPNSLSHNHTLEQGDLATIVLQALGLSHSHTLDQTTVTLGGNVQLVPNSLSHSHSLEQGGIDITLLIDDLSHGHSLQGGELIVVLSPEDLAHSHALAQADLQTITLDPNDLSHPHALQDGTIIVQGEATQVTLTARKLYQVQLSESKLYRITLNEKQVIE